MTTIIKNISLSQLVASPSNVRKTYTANGIAELAANIAAVGLLQNLQVQKAGNGKFAVVAGERRRRALNLLAKQKALPKDAAIPCHVLTSENAREVSLSENEMREAMHPADQCEAFKALIDAGQGVEDVAARFGVTPLVVRQRLKLAGVSPKLLALYRAGELNLDQMMAFTVSDDAAAQEAAWFDAPDWQRQAHHIRQRLIAAHVRADDRRAVFVTVDAYVAAGGGVIADLFQTRRYLADPALLDRLAAEKLESEAATVRAEGWKWVEIVPEIDGQMLRGFEEVRGKRQPLSAKDAKKLGKLKRERDTLQRRDDLTDEEMTRHNGLQGVIAALEETAVVFTDRQKARAGAFVSISHHGALQVVRGLVRPADQKAKRTESDEAEAGTPKPPGLSRALVDDLTAHCTAALRTVLSERADVALAALLHAFALRVIYDEGGTMPLALQIFSPALHGEGIDDSAATQRLHQQREAWATQLPAQPEGLWDWLRTQGTDTLLALLAHCIACTVEPTRGGEADRLAAAVALDMKDWWEPTPAYFGRVPKPLILEAVAEAKDGKAAEALATLKKGEMATKAAELLTGTGWLPAMLRAA